MTERITIDTLTTTCPCGEEFDSVIVSGSRPPTKCPLCQKRDEDLAVHQARERDASAIEPRLAKLGINVRKHGKVRLDEMGPPAAGARDFILATTTASRWEFVPGLYLVGPTGVGKTQLAVAIVRELLEGGYGGSIVFDRARALITTVQDRYGGGSVDEVIERRRSAGLWVLDDLGTEKPTSDAFRILEDILDSREGHPTVLTSNLTRVQLANAWAGQDSLNRFRSRLGPQNYREVRIDGVDRRFA